MEADVLIIGAGIAGLSCARALTRSGLHPLVLERSRGLGGRCATRRIDGQPVDHGAGFYHGDDPDFLAALESSAGPIADWPRRVEGHGAPCQPRAFASGERRVAFRDGMTAFPKMLAQDLSIVRETNVRSIEARGAELRLITEGGDSFRAGQMVLALPVGQSRKLLSTIEDAPHELDATCRLLEMVGTVRCLTLIATYPVSTTPPDWDIWYPEQSRVLQTISHDSSKRDRPEHLVLVYQALPCWSGLHWDRDPDIWRSKLLQEAAHLLGSWAAAPLSTQTHRWHHGRSDAGNELSGPIVVPLEGGQRIGLAGEVFSPGGGVQAAWRSGILLAKRFAEEVTA